MTFFFKIKIRQLRTFFSLSLGRVLPNVKIKLRSNHSLWVGTGGQSPMFFCGKLIMLLGFFTSIRKIVISSTTIRTSARGRYPLLHYSMASSTCFMIRWTGSSYTFMDGNILTLGRTPYQKGSMHECIEYRDHCPTYHVWYFITM